MKCSQHNYLDHKRSHLQVGRHDVMCAYIIIIIIMTMTCHVTSSLLLLSPMQSETMEDDDVSRFALPRQDVVMPLLYVLDRHVLILPSSYLCLDLSIFLMMFFRSISFSWRPTHLVVFGCCELPRMEPPSPS